MSERNLAIQLVCSTRQFRSTERAVSEYGEASTAGINAVMHQESKSRVSASGRKQVF